MNDIQDNKFKQDLDIFILHAKKLNEFKNNIEDFIDYINLIDNKIIQDLYNQYADSYYWHNKKELRAVNSVRFVILDKILKGNKITTTEINILINNFKNQNSEFFINYPKIYEYLPLMVKNKRYFKSWSIFSILFQFYYKYIKKEVYNALNNIIGLVLVQLNLQNYQAHIKDFAGNQNFGRDEADLMIYPKGVDTFRDAYQLYIHLLPDYAIIGTYIGENVENPKIEKESQKIEYNKITLEKIVEIFKLYFKKIDSLNQELLNADLLGIALDLSEEIKEEEIQDDNPLLLYEDTNIDIEEITRGLMYKKQIILMGPPGTSKTFLATQLALKLTKNKDHIELIQFHPHYSYEDFVEGKELAGGDNGNAFKFIVKSKIFTNFCNLAAADLKKDPSSLFIMIIDEINRGNVEKIFGELIFALEYRNKPVKLLYSNQVLQIPKNLYIIGTMNTIDLSIANIDAALRRRFFIYELMPDSELLLKWLNNHFNNEFNDIITQIISFFESLNRHIIDNDEDIGEYQTIGHSYFIFEGISDIHEYLRNIELTWRYSIQPMLLEYHQFGSNKIEEYISMFDNFTRNVKKLEEKKNDE